MKESGLEVDEATLRMNLWLSQGLVLAAAAISSFWVHGWKGTLGLFSFQGWPGIGIACCVAVGIVVLNLVMEIFFTQALAGRWQLEREDFWSHVSGHDRHDLCDRRIC